ncbi:uncharacterized protein LOC129802348 isoform X2 [Phlebotomus papatasi]|uniref:uncharacterized protein LOC129802348 isoform X2 n=1 Tax=Phlebotomus papatasi TaxID=29031 RepID=UPI002483D58E|nr:uncharacterized protein LOC129802348 isoform X2 [Phlebotomus papatasi]
MAKEIGEEYLSSLADLNVNSKPLINMLTIIAEENIEHAEVIVKAVEHHLAKVNPDIKLPVLYLIDSIVKNVGRDYKALFSQYIVNMFCGVFEKVNEKVREKMFALRQTWNEVFSQQKLYTLDVKINCMDPGWPITAKVKSPAIHLNPNFLKNKAAGDPKLTEMAKLSEMQSQLRDKQRELLELQKHKLELELVATRQRIEEEEKKINLQTASVKMVNPPPIMIPPSVSVPPPNSMGFLPRPGTFPSVMPPHTRPPITATATIAPFGPMPPIPMAGKTRVAPVNPALVSSVQMRDPRLVRQMQQQMARAAEASSSVRFPGPGIGVGGGGGGPGGNKGKMMEARGGTMKSISGSRKVITNKENKSRSTSSSSSSSHGKSQSTSKVSSSSSSSSSKSGGKSSSTSPKGKEKSSASSKERTRRDSSSSSSSGKGGKHRRSHSGDRAKSEKKEHPQVPVVGEKSPKRLKEAPPEVEEAVAVPSTSSNVPNASIFKDMKLAPGTRSFLKQPARTTKSPTPPAPPTMTTTTTTTTSTAETSQVPASCVADVDLRISAPAKLIESTPVAEKAPPVEQPQSSENSEKQPEVKVSSETDEKKKIIDASLTDVDLRQFPSGGVNDAQTGASATQATVQNAEEVKATNDVPATGTKRAIEEEEEVPVTSKKSKSDKLDVLFGSQDMDLRTLGAIKAASEAEPLTPPPPPIISNETESNWAKLKPKTFGNSISRKTKRSEINRNSKPLQGDTPKKQNQLKASLAAIRAKLAEATKPKKPPVQITEILERKRKLPNKFANATPVETSAETVASKTEILAEESSSQDANDASIKIIVAQAQEQLDNESIDQEQYNSMMKQVMQLNETHKMKEAQKREAGDDAARRKLRHQMIKRKSPDPTTPTIESSFATTTAADLRRSENARPSVWDTSAPWQNAFAASAHMINPLANNLQHAWNNPLAPFGNFSAAQNVAEVLQQQQQQLALATQVKQTNMLTIKIDNVPREIRFYDDIAIAFMNWDHPKEIGFQAGQRRITCDDKYSTVLSFNATNTPWTIDGVTYQIRLGCPTRELYIDNKWYECFFNDPIRVELNGVMRTIKIDGPPPQVRIGSLRTDLVVGKINVIIDAVLFIPVFLDGNEQQFEIDGQVHTLQFADFLLTVIINGIPSPVVFGGLPKSYDLRGQKHFIRFTALPAGVVPGKCFIRNMIRTTLQTDLESPPPPSSATTAAAALAAAAAENPSLQGPIGVAKEEDGELTNNAQANPDVEVPAATADDAVTDVQKPKDGEKAPVLNVNIDDLFQKLLASGILAGGQSTLEKSSRDSKSRHEHSEHKSRSSKEKAVKPVSLSRPETIKTRQSAIVHQLFSGMQCSSCGVRFPPEQTMKYSQHLDWHFRQNRRDRDSARKAHSRKWYYDVADWIQYEEIEDLEEREKNWFETQQLELDAGQEDSNQRGGADSPVPSCLALPDDSNRICDVCHDPFEQFYNEETEEWHLRPAIRVEDRTYHPLCYADYQASLTLSESKLSESQEDETAANDTADDDDVKMVEDDEVVIVKQEKIDDEAAEKERILRLGLVPNGDKPTIVPGLDAEDDDVIEVAPLEPTITEILDDDDDDEQQQNSEKENSSTEKSPTKSTSAQFEESDVEIQEPHIPIQDLDEIEDEEPTENQTPAEEAPAKEPLVVKIKEEPKDDGYNEDDAFMDVGTSFDPNEEMIIDEETLDERPPGTELQNGQDGDKKAEGASQDADSAAAVIVVSSEAVAPAKTATGSEVPQMIATIDGNVEMQEAPSTTSTNKIRINISNSVVVGNKPQSSINNVSDPCRDGAQESTEGVTENLLKPSTVKQSLKGHNLRTNAPFANGFETSGLCSIM